MANQNDINLLEKIKIWFKKVKPIKKGDIGIYHYIWASETFNEISTGLRYDVFTKIKAIELYDNLVEIEVIDIKINDSASQDVINMITNNVPKYIRPKQAKWIING